MMAAGNVLVNEIYDHFLVCKVCQEGFKSPKTLSCQHTFCKDCLVKHHETEQDRPHGYRFLSRSVSCPVCRKRTDLPIGGIPKLSDNFLVSNLYEVVERRRQSRPRASSDCDICRPTTMTTGARTRVGNDNQGYYRCLDCSKTLCRRCADLHRRTKVTQDHGLFDAGVRDRDVQCRVHRDETIRFFCEPCGECICVLCTFQDHKDHEVFTFTEGLERHCRSFDALLERSRGQCGRLREQIDLIVRYEASVKATEDYIRESAMDWVRQIRQQERGLLRELKELFGCRAREFVQRKAELQETLTALENTSNLTEIVVKDRSVELLMLKNEINKKLDELLTDDRLVRSPPDFLTRSVVFVPGNCFLGELDFEDEDYEILTGGTHQGMTKTRCSEHGSRSFESANIPFSEDGGGQGKEAFDDDRPSNKTEKKEIIGRKSTSESCTPDVMLPDISKKIRSTKTSQKEKLIEKFQSGAETASARLKPPSGLCRCSNKRKSLVYVDRSTMTSKILDRGSDKVLDTTGLIRTTEASTQSQRTTVRSAETATDAITKVNKTTFTTSAEYLDKSVMTESPCFLSSTTNTLSTAVQDMAVMAETVVTRETSTSTDTVETACQSTCTDDADAAGKIVTTKVKHCSNANSSKKSKLSLATVAKQTANVAPTTACHGYEMLRRQTRISLSRGTATERTPTMERETSTDPPLSVFVDRASSPIRFSGVDKAVSVSRGEIVEPVDTFQTPGKHQKLLGKSGPKLDVICEGSDEPSSDDDGDLASAGPHPIRQRFTSRGVSSAEHQRGGGGVLMHREKFAPSFGSKLRGPQTSSIFSVEGRRSASSIMWKVEMGTNTSCVELQDKAIGTDSMTLDTKMAECISKLKTVRQRLETKQTANASTSTSGSKESPDMTTSTSSVESAERRSSVQTSPKPQRDRLVLSITRTPQSPRKQRRAYTRPESSPSESSDQELISPSTPSQRTSMKRPSTLARKQRTAIGDMLRSPSSSSAAAASTVAKTRSPRIIRKQPSHSPQNT